MKEAEIICRIALELRDVTVDRLLRVKHFARFILKGHRGAKQGRRDCRELAQPEGEWTIVLNGFEKRNVMESVRGIQREPVYYIE